MLYYQIKTTKISKTVRTYNKGKRSDIQKEQNIARTFKESPVAPVLFETQRLQPVAHIRYGRLAEKVTEAVKESGRNDGKLTNKVELIGETYHSGLYRTNESKGICEDMDKSSVCYINVERNRTFKMKSGKFMRTLILETEIGKLLSPGNPELVFPEMSSPDNGTPMPTGMVSGLKLHVDNRF